jgi:hypothetical protein
LTRGISVQQKDQLQRLLLVPEGDRVSLLDQIRSGPTRISGPAIRAAIDRLNTVRALGITVPMKAHIPSSRIASLARFANRAKAQAISRMPAARRFATLVAFVHCLEATAQDEVLEVLEMLLHDLFGKAITARSEGTAAHAQGSRPIGCRLGRGLSSVTRPRAAGRKPAQESVRKNSTSGTGKMLLSESLP